MRNFLVYFKLNKNTHLYLALIILNSCGDIINFNKKIAENYYLIHSESGNGEEICFKVGMNEFIERVPSRVTEYAIIDSLIVAKTIDNNEVRFYIINKNRDSQYCDEREYLVAIDTPLEFKKRMPYLPRFEFIKVSY